jgi:hypothetical protein
MERAFIRDKILHYTDAGAAAVCWWNYDVAAIASNSYSTRPGGLWRDSIVNDWAGHDPLSGTTLLDDFNRANGALGASWLGPANSASTGTVAVASNAAQVTTAYMSAVYTTEFGPAQGAFVDIAAALEAGDSIDVLLRIEETGATPTYLICRYTNSAGNQTFSCRQVTAGSESTLATSAANLFELASGDTYGATISADNAVLFWLRKSGTSVWQNVHRAFPVRAVASLSRVGFGSSATETMDNFRGGGA